MLYGFDLGLNLNIISTGQLQIGFVDMNAPGGSMPGDPNNLNVGDVVFFNLFNLTNPASLVSTIDPSSSLTFLPVEGATSRSPFELVTPTDAVSTIVPVQVSNAAPGPSAIYGPNTNFPAWNVLPATKIVASGPFTMLVTLSINNQAQSFSATASFTVQ